MVTYKIKYMHGDADGYTNKTFIIKEEYENKLIKEILKIFEDSKPEWRENFLYKIEESLIEEYLIENYDEDEDSPELWEEGEKILRKERAIKFLEIIKEITDKNLISNEYELEMVKNVLNLENQITEEEFYKKIFDLAWDLSDIMEILISDITCEDRFAQIKKLKIE